jgi:hypothetical protein
MWATGPQRQRTMWYKNLNIKFKNIKISGEKLQKIVQKGHQRWGKIALIIMKYITNEKNLGRGSPRPRDKIMLVMVKLFKYWTIWAEDSLTLFKVYST